MEMETQAKWVSALGSLAIVVACLIAVIVAVCVTGCATIPCPNGTTMRLPDGTPNGCIYSGAVRREPARREPARREPNRRANLRDANLRDANLRGAKGLEQFCILPQGELIGYKKLANGTIAKLRIPAKAARVNAYGSRKCRAEYAVVISGSGTATHRSTVKYAPRERIVPDKYDPDPRVECSHSIHFFITEQEARDY